MAFSDDPIIRLTPFSQFFMEYGQLLGAWNSFEVLVEVVIMRELRLTVEEANIVCASLNFQAKFSIAKSLLRRTKEGEKQAIALSSAQSIAERNSFAHGFISVNETGRIFTLVRRDVKDSLKVTPRPMTSRDMQKHGHAFYAEFEKATKACGITDEELIVYQRGAESLAQAPKAQASHRPESPPNFRSAKQQRRHQLRAQRRAEKADKNP